MQEAKLGLFMHSLANYLLELSLANGQLSGIHEDLFDNLILNAPAVASKNHHEWIEKLDMQKRAYICYNDIDFNLAGLIIYIPGRQNFVQHLDFHQVFYYIWGKSKP
ncbi:MAG: hypothetical protein MUC31_09045 [Bacteroidales bacterium]|nr:hypothetical protein [Bacteroidales bacterium]